jgi:transposase-like protein
VVEGRKKCHLQSEVRAHVEPGSTVYSDALQSYSGLNSEYVHKVIDHAESYAEGAVHTNGLENFWCLFKRSVKGTYVSVEPFHLFRYLDEQAFRFNERGLKDGGRFLSVLRSIVGKRLTFAELTGAEMCPR